MRAIASLGDTYIAPLELQRALDNNESFNFTIFNALGRYQKKDIALSTFQNYRRQPTKPR